mmetsp:Transcript_53658/g.165031  ORF Transcript_53658/g.165031 Transcript_53658/m.165031 type:complete len:238 (+) Transcript_53658:683-1396(+)
MLTVASARSSGTSYSSTWRWVMIIGRRVLAAVPPDLWMVELPICRSCGAVAAFRCAAVDPALWPRVATVCAYIAAAEAPRWLHGRAGGRNPLVGASAPGGRGTGACAAALSPPAAASSNNRRSPGEYPRVRCCWTPSVASLTSSCSTQTAMYDRRRVTWRSSGAAKACPLAMNSTRKWSSLSVNAAIGMPGTAGARLAPVFGPAPGACLAALSARAPATLLWERAARHSHSATCSAS